MPQERRSAPGVTPSTPECRGLAPRTTMLPLGNPVCVHEWEASLNLYIWVCRRCGYEVSELERLRHHEGEEAR